MSQLHANESRRTTVSSTLSHDVLVSATAQIVSAYVAGRTQETLNLNQLMADVYAQLAQLAHAVPAAQQGKLVPVSVEESVKPDYLICLEDGKRVKMLKRYLKTNYNMTPEQYRNRWNLPDSYPMVAPNYARVRSNLAKQIGLGTRGMSLAARQMSAGKAAPAQHHAA